MSLVDTAAILLNKLAYLVLVLIYLAWSSCICNSKLSEPSKEGGQGWSLAGVNSLLCPGTGAMLVGVVQKNAETFLCL